MKTIYWTYQINHKQIITVDINQGNLLNSYGYEINDFKELTSLI